jgi:hypothetical protein
VPAVKFNEVYEPPAALARSGNVGAAAHKRYSLGFIMLFDFWRELPPGDTIHPADRVLLKKFPNTFETGMPPGQINGRFKTALVVACFVNPGFDDEDRALLQDPVKRQLLLDQLDGTQQFPIWIPGWKSWFLERVGRIELPEYELASTVATFNACAYASKNTKKMSRSLVNQLPSTLIARKYLHEILIPKAKERKVFLVFCRGNWAWKVDKSIENENIRFAPNPVGGHFGERIGKDINLWLRSVRNET